MTPLYAGIGGVVRELTEMYTGIGGVVKPMTEMWAGVSGVERQIFSSAKPAVVTIKTRQYTGWDPEDVYVVIDGVKYTSDQDVTTTVGAIMDCVLNASSYELASVYINGEEQTVPQGTKPWHFQYQIPGNITVSPSSEGFPGGNTATINIFT